MAVKIRQRTMVYSQFMNHLDEENGNPEKGTTSRESPTKPVATPLHISGNQLCKTEVSFSINITKLQLTREFFIFKSHFQYPES